MNDRPMKRKYARVERERRFLLSQLPEGLDPNAYHRLHDLFVQDTHLRLRRVETPAGSVVIIKLGQKIEDPEAPLNCRHRLMTTIYLTEQEGAVLTLPGLRTVKRRYQVPEQGRTFCIDVWEEPAAAAGIIVAEVECDTDEELDAIVCPAWADREVTDDPTYSAINLAQR